MGDIYTNPPQSRNEAILRATIDGTEYTAPPQSRIEDLLLELKEAIEQGGAGGMSKNTYDPDDVVADAGGITAYVDGEITDLHLGTASTKNSTSVVTQSTDLVESGAVYDAIESAYQLVEDTVEWTGKNLLIQPFPNRADSEFPTTGGHITWSLNTDHSITITSDGTPTTQEVSLTLSVRQDTEKTLRLKKGKYIFSGNATTNGDTKLQFGTTKNNTFYLLAQTENYEVEFDVTDDILVSGKDYASIAVYLIVPTGKAPNNVTFYPMIRRADIIDNTYKPYHESVEQTLRDAEVVEGKNLFDPSIISQTDTIIYSPIYVGYGEFTCSTTAPKNQNNSANLFLLAGNVQSGLNTDINGVWNDQPRTVTAIDGYVTIVTRSRDDVNIANYNNQLEKGSTATAYEPYYIPLKDVVPNKCDNSVIGTVEDGTNPTKAYAVGEHFIRNGKFCTVTVAVTTSSTWTLGSNYVEGTIADNLVKQDTFSGTTTETGIVEIYNGNRNVIKCESSGGNRIIQPFYSYSRSKVMARCIYENGSVIENDVVSGTYYYI